MLGPLPSASVTYEELIAALRRVPELRDRSSDSHPNFFYKSRPFLHFHVDDQGRAYADVFLGGHDFEEQFAHTDSERDVLYALVLEHVEETDRSRPRRRR